jgi:DNA replication protein DnaC
MTASADKDLRLAARELGLWGLLAEWDALVGTNEAEAVVRRWIAAEEEERSRRGFERRLKEARLGRFRLLDEFDWVWPKRCDRSAIEELLRLIFLAQAANVVLAGPNGVGKTMIAKNIAYQAVRKGHSVCFVTASELLNDLAAQDGSSALRRRFGHYVNPNLLVIDELGYLSYDNRHADLLFEIVSRRYEKDSIIVTTNKPFAEWKDIFPNAGSVVTLVDRLVHRSEILEIQGESYRLKEAQEQAAKRAAERSSVAKGRSAEGKRNAG